MKLFRYGPVGQEKPGVIYNDEHLDVSASVHDYDERFFGSDGLQRLRSRLLEEGSSFPRLERSTLRFAPAIARPSKIVCVGLNYRKHAAETGAAAPAEPILFFKSTTALCGPNDAVMLPRGSQKTDYEVELVVVIGKTARYVEQSAALDYVAGYALHNDYSERGFQLERGGQWVKGKSADYFAPLGPLLLTTDEVEHDDIELWLNVNGERRQTGNTSDMIFSVPHLVSYISEFMTLLPSDVISTGTPAGVALGRTPTRYLKPGDVVELDGGPLGRACQRIVAFSEKTA